MRVHTSVFLFISAGHAYFDLWTLVLLYQVLQARFHFFLTQLTPWSLRRTTTKRLQLFYHHLFSVQRTHNTKKSLTRLYILADSFLDLLVVCDSSWCCLIVPCCFEIIFLVLRYLSKEQEIYVIELIFYKPNHVFKRGVGIPDYGFNQTVSFSNTKYF